MLLPRLTRPDQAMLRSSSGPGAGAWLATLPVSKATRMRPGLFQVALRRRLRLHLCLGLRSCPGTRCGCRLDRKGDHLAACPRTGLLARRAKPLERAWQQVLREAGARVVPQQMMRDMDLAVQATDGRQLDGVAYGLPLFGGVPLCGDATLVSPLDARGQCKYGSDSENGAALHAACRRKARRYPELHQGSRGRLVCLGCEVGGRWSHEAWKLLQHLSASKCRTAPGALQRSARLAWHRRWASVVAVAAQTALAASLAEPAGLTAACVDGQLPAPLDEVLCEARQPPGFSRLAWRSC